MVRRGAMYTEDDLDDGYDDDEGYYDEDDAYDAPVAAPPPKVGPRAARRRTCDLRTGPPPRLGVAALACLRAGTAKGQAAAATTTTAAQGREAACACGGSRCIPAGPRAVRSSAASAEWKAATGRYAEQPRTRSQPG